MELAAPSSSAGTSPNPQGSLQLAIEEFQSILTDEQRRKLGMIGSIRDAQSVMIFTAQLDRENQSGGRPGVASRLSTVLQSVQAFSTVVETFVSSHPEIAALVWGSVKLTMLIAVNFTSYFEALSSLFMVVSKQCPRFAEYQALYPASTRLQRALCDFHASIIRCCKHVVGVLQRSWKQQLKHAIFQSFHEEMKEDVRAIQQMGEEVKEEIFLAAARAQHEDEELHARERQAAARGRSRLWKFIPNVENDLRGMKEMQMQQSRRKTREERQRLLESLSSHDYLTPFRDACKKRQRNTAEWIFAVPEFKRWCEGSGPPLLWCSGKIGSGKTILCANVINHVFLHKGCGDSATFFFVDRDNADSLRAETMVRSIIRQSIGSTAVPQYVESQLRNLDRAIFVQLDAWTGLLQSVIQQSKAFYILIDGLDECDAAERRAVLDALSLLAATASHMRIFMSSRHSVDLDLRCRSLPVKRVLMSCDSLMSDIHTYVDASIQKRLQNEELAFGDPHLLIEVNDALTRHADGMFLWVTFLIDEICAGSCDDDIRRSLHELPKDLEETFKRALLRIFSRAKHLELVQRTFRWVAAARRPLTLDELREAVSVDLGQKNSRTERLPHNMGRIVLWCENLLHLTDEEPAQVQFAHASIRDFITRAPLSQQLCGFHVDLEHADHFAGEICVTYLHFSDFTTTISQRQRPVQLDPVRLATTALSREQKMARVSGIITDFASRRRKTMTDPDLSRVEAMYGRAHSTDMKKLQNSHPFLMYAATHWVTHTVHFQKEQGSTWELWLRLVSSCSSLAQTPWLKSSSKQDEQGLLIWSHRTRHYALLRHALSNLRQYELKEVHDLMKISATQGDIKTISIFLQACTWPTSCLSTSLEVGSAGGHIQVVERLLDAGADVNAAAAGYEGRTALQAASGSCHFEVVERLLDAGADVNATPAKYSGQTALQAASSGGYLEVVERLLGAGADVNAAAARYEGRTALQAASDGGYLEVVERLLSAGADVNAAPDGYEGRTALQAASNGGYLMVVERLLDAGGDVNARATRTGHTALQAASGGGYLKVIERLLGAGADVHAAPAESEGRTALQAASGSGHFEVVERLLGAGADVNAAAARYEGRTALQAASGVGYLEVVERLLGAGADVNATPTNNRGQTALQAASDGGHFKVVERLLEAGADVNTAAARYEGRTALQAASGGGYLEVVKRLLGAGADVNATPASDRGQTALQAASGGGYLEVVKRLLGAGADVNATPASDRGQTALQAASDGGHFKVVERLLDAGADVNTAAAENEGRTALQAASGGGYLKLVERLLEAGADVNSRAAKHGGRTALQAASDDGYLEVVERLLSAGADVNTRATLFRQTALQQASSQGYIEIVERLLGAGADVNATPAKLDGRTALQAASNGGHFKVVERLLDAGADVNAAAAENGGRTALQAASDGGYLEVVERLLVARADVNARAAKYGGRTALQAASDGGYSEVVERLLGAGADVNAAAAAENGGRTALQAASGGGYLEVVERLLGAGADVNAAAAENGGRTALQAASDGGYPEVVERLLVARADVNARAAKYGGRTALQAASDGGYLEVVERLLGAGADVNAAPAEHGGRTAVQAASGGGCLRVVERLLVAGADVNAAAAEHGGHTALRAASGVGYLEVVERLLGAGADVNATPASDRGQTALQSASDGGYLEVVERLLVARADVNARAAKYEGRTALQAASDGGYLEVVERLRDTSPNDSDKMERASSWTHSRQGPRFCLEDQ